MLHRFTWAYIYAQALFSQSRLELTNLDIAERLAHIKQSDSSLIERGLLPSSNDPSPVSSAMFVLITWLMSKNRPLSLDCGPLYHSILVYYTDQETISEELVFNSILEKCKPFVSIDYGTGLVRFTERHMASECDFLRSPKARRIKLAIARAYLDYIEHNGSRMETSSADSENAHFFQDHGPLGHVLYWADYCRDHLDALGPLAENLANRIIGFLDTAHSRLAFRRLLSMDPMYLLDADSAVERPTSTHAASLTKLHIASRLRLTSIVSELVKSDPHAITQQDDCGSTPLHEAAKAGFADVVEALLSHSNSLPVKMNNYGYSALSVAMKHGHTDIFVRLFEAQCTLHWLTDPASFGITNFHDVACKYCSAKLKIDESAVDREDRGRILMNAIQKKLENVAELFLNLDTDLDIIYDGTSPLHAAVDSLQDGIAAQLVSRGANPMIELPRGGQEPLLHRVIRLNLQETLSCLLSSWHLDINCRDSAGRTALFTAMDCDDETKAYHLAVRLLRSGLNLDLVDREGCHILHFAAGKGFCSIIYDILFRIEMAEPPRDGEGRTPAFWALRNNHEQAWKILGQRYGWSERELIDQPL